MDSTDLTLRGLDRSRDAYFLWLLISTAVVAVGVIAEGPQVYDEIHREITRSKRRPLPPAAEGKPDWRLLLASFGWLLIVVGVAAEGIFEGLVANTDARIQALEDSRVKQASERATSAFKEAQDAFNKSKTASEDATSAFNRAAFATRQAEISRVQAETLRLRAEDEARKRIAIEQQLAWRTLTAVQTKQLSSRLPSQFVGTTLVVTNVMGDAEGRAYAGALWEALRKAGWGDSENPGLKGTGIGNPRALSFPAAVPEGLQIVERGKTEAASLLRNAMSSCGIEVTELSIPLSTSGFNLSDGPMSSGMAAALDAMIQPNTLEIRVGVKPSHRAH